MATKARQLSSVPGTFRNKIINGDFDIWQRGVSQTSSGYGSADRWRNTHAGSTKTTSRQAFTFGQTDVPGNPTYYMRTVVASVAEAGNYVRSSQRIEGVSTFSGETVTVHFYAKADAAKNISISFDQSFGSGGSPSPIVNNAGTKIALTTLWVKHSVTVALPSISGKTLGDASDNLEMHLWFDAGSNFDARTDSLGQQSGTFDIAQVQVEAGPVATEFEQRDVGMELALCQRYYSAGVLGSTSSGGSSSGCALGGVFPVEMRAAPTGTYEGAFTLYFRGIGTYATSGVLTWGVTSTRGFHISTVTTATFPGDGMGGHVSDEGAVRGVSWDAEL